MAWVWAVERSERRCSSYNTYSTVSCSRSLSSILRPSLSHSALPPPALGIQSFWDPVVCNHPLRVAKTRHSGEPLPHCPRILQLVSRDRRAGRPPLSLHNRQAPAIPLHQYERKRNGIGQQGTDRYAYCSSARQLRQMPLFRAWSPGLMHPSFSDRVPSDADDKP